MSAPDRRRARSKPPPSAALFRPSVSKNGIACGRR